MSIVRAYVLPHPPLAIPDVGRGQEKGIAGTMAAFDDVACQIAELAPEVIVYVTPHSVLYADYFHISPGLSAKGDFSRFGAPGVCVEADYDSEFAAEVARIAAQWGIPAGSLGERDAGLDHGFTVPAWFINRRCGGYKALRISQSGLDHTEHYRLGQVISEAAERLDRRTVLVASADLSHKLAHDGPYGFSPEGPVFDGEIKKILDSGDFLSLLMISEALREGAGECGYNSLTIMAGCFDKRTVKARLISYECPFGVGYAVASIEPGEADSGRGFLDQFTRASLDEARRKQEAEDEYRALARKSLEYTVENGGELPFPDRLPDELRNRKAGVFVSLHKNGRLRGCVGTISPSTRCIASEIIQNAVSAGLSDNRFEPVSAAELQYLTYKVDVLSAPEPISGVHELDVKRYGVIVTSGYKRGLLLPNLDGVDTVDEQISIARKKAGISDNAKIELERFEVVRHE